jgi:hypothetical protein
MEENMSLLDDAMVDCVLMEKKREPDGAGGFITEWYEGASFKATISVNTTIEAQIAEAQGIKRIYSVITNKNAILDPQDVFKRLHDDATFRVTSDGHDVVTPKSAFLNKSQVTAKREELPI